MCAVFCSSAWGQTSSVQGHIVDPSGGVVPKAVVTVLKDSQAVKTAETDGQGRYRITLAPGKYEIHVVAKGFATYENAEVEVPAGQRLALDIPLTIGVDTEKVTVADSTKVDLDPASNAGALVLRGADLEALPDNRDDLAIDLQALAGPAAGPNGGQIFIDGFTGGRLPSKLSIREVRINQNPFAAQFDRPGQGRIEIFTKPGTEEYHGQLTFQFGDDMFNSRNPFIAVKPPYQRRQWEGEVSGPLGKRTSFFFDFERRDVDENAFINALTLDQNLQMTPLVQAVVVPVASVELDLRVDRQLSANHTLTTRYVHAQDANDNQGIGGFSTASRGFKVRDTENTFVATETAVLNTHMINEVRFRYRRQRGDQTGRDIAPTISVLDAFTGGGSPLSVSHDYQNRYELQNFTTLAKGRHAVRWGGLMRGISLSNRDTQNYAGTFTFTSLESYRLTLLGLRSGLTAEQIRATGGGASQFSLSGGNPLATLNQFDFGFFVQDDWRLKPTFTVNAGLRYETQTHSGDRTDFAPRLGFAWGIGAAKNKAPKNVIRGGFGIFYDRLGESLTLDSLRLDGIHQQQFLVPFPNFYPTIPNVQSLTGDRQPQAIRRVDSQWRAPMLLQSAMAFERQLPKGITVSTNYIHTRGVHALRSRNINAPLPETGAYPFGGVNSIYLYETSGLYRQHQLITNLNARVNAKMTLSGFYAWGSAKSNTDGASSFPANQYDLATEYSRAGFDVRHRFLLQGSFAAPWGFRLSPFVTAASGRPYNITLGRDLNGDSLYTDRPGVAAASSQAAVRTPYGVFDPAPRPGQAIISRNLGEAPGMVAVNVRLGKAFEFGEHDTKGGKAAGDPRQLLFSISARNLLNHPNLAAPSGNLSSPLFGRSTSLAGGGGGVTGNRRIELQVRFSF